jgi:hypothetical protein
MTGTQYAIESAIDEALENDELYGQRQTLIETIRYAQKLLEDVESDIEAMEKEDNG